MEKEIMQHKTFFAEVELIFVVGTARSGTTLMSKILGNIPDAYSPGESHFFEDIWSRRNEIGELTNSASLEVAVQRMMAIYGRYHFKETQGVVDSKLDSKEIVQQISHDGGNYASLYHTFMVNLAIAQNKTLICDDTPRHLFYLPTILSWFPTAKVIACVRDPRDFLSSYKHYWRRSEDSERMKALYHPVTISLLWRSSNNLLAKALQQYNQSQILLVQYENLVKQPQEVLQNVCDFLDVKYSNNLLFVDTQNSSFLPDIDKAYGIFDTSVGKWQKGLESHEVWWVQLLTGHLMQYFDYAELPINPSWVKILATLFQAPRHLVIGLGANREKRGPLLKYLWRRLLPLIRR